MKETSPRARARAESNFQDTQKAKATEKKFSPQYESDGTAVRQKMARLKALREAKEAVDGRLAEAKAAEAALKKPAKAKPKAAPAAKVAKPASANSATGRSAMGSKPKAAD